MTLFLDVGNNWVGFNGLAERMILIRQSLTDRNKEKQPDWCISSLVHWMWLEFSLIFLEFG